MMPDVRAGQPPGSFRITQGILYRASEFARQDDHAALIIIDEINRGPTVQVFGGAIVAMEADKRLGADGKPTPRTQFFDLIDPADGELIEYAFPSRLYILAAMNQADVSVEPLDVAFLRRWTPYNLEPDTSILRNYFGISATPVTALPATPTTAEDVCEAAIQAFDAVNARIALGRGAEFRIGHGVFMAGSTPPANLADTQEYFATAWRTLKNHIDEAFFGDVRGTAIILNADRGIAETHIGLKKLPLGMLPAPLSVALRPSKPHRFMISFWLWLGKRFNAPCAHGSASLPSSTRSPCRFMRRLRAKLISHPQRRRTSCSEPEIGYAPY
jgi:5-methylcytosine-specific restriction protein B